MNNPIMAMLVVLAVLTGLACWLNVDPLQKRVAKWSAWVLAVVFVVLLVADTGTFPWLDWVPVDLDACYFSCQADQSTR
jgi:hypothetical protein